MEIKRGKGYELNKGHCFVSLSPGQGNKLLVLTTKLKLIISCHAKGNKFAAVGSSSFGF